MLIIGVLTLSWVANSSISDTLCGYHWPLCPKNKLLIVKSGLIRLAKLPLPELNTLIAQYLSKEEIVKALKPTNGEDILIVQELRKMDIAALTRMTFVGVPRYSKGKWFGPFNGNDDMWHLSKHNWVLREETSIHVFAASFEAKSEFEYYSRLLPRRFSSQ